jgi:hypothetical protein
MVAVTYGVARVPTIKPAEAQTAAPRKSFFTRLVEALIESRMRKARAEIRKHRHLMPYTFDERTNRLVKIEPGDMPFGGW